MSADSYRRQLQSKREQRLAAERKAGEHRSKESTKRAAAAKARQAAGSTRSATTAKSKLREAERLEKEAGAAGQEASRWQDKASGYGKQEMSLQGKLDSSVRTEEQQQERRRLRDQQVAQRRAAAERADLESRLARAEAAAATAMTAIRPPKPEKLRILLLGSTAAGDLRIGREQSRIRASVERALHRDAVELDARPAATTADLLDGITRFRPHVVHFSGHSDEALIEFEDDVDEPHNGVLVSAHALASAVTATDEPPMLVLLNSCSSAGQAERLVGDLVPMSIGMADEIGDGDAIVYAAQFYAALANGQSVRAAHLSGCAALELAGLESSDLPVLAYAPSVNPSDAVLVRPSR